MDEEATAISWEKIYLILAHCGHCISDIFFVYFLYFNTRNIFINLGYNKGTRFLGLELDT